MAISYPRTDIIEALSIHDGYFTPMWRQEYSRTASGITTIKDLGPMLWMASYTTVATPNNEIGRIETQLMSLRGGIELFEGYDPQRPDPVAADPGDNLGSVTVANISADKTQLALAGLPSGFFVTAGDYLSVDDGTNLHLLRAAENISAGAGGTTPLFDVLPFVRPSIGNGQTVTLRKPCARFQAMPDTIQRQYVNPLFSTITFQATQVIV